MINAKFQYLAVATLCFAFALPAVVIAQTNPDALIVYEPGTENLFFPGGRAAGMGGAQIAAANDGSALLYNPALLTKVRNTELSATLTHQRFKNETSISGGPVPEAKVNNTGFGGLWIIYPVPAERGGLSVGFSVNRVRDFDRIFRYSSAPGWLDNPTSSTGWGGGEDENGSLWAWSFGAGVEVSPKTSLGAALEVYSGHDEFLSFFDSTYTPSGYVLQSSHNINDDYTGISGKVGASYAATNYLNFGAVIGFPTSFSIDQTSDFFDNINGNATEDHSAASYRYTLPFWFGLGSSVFLRDLMLTGDVSYRDYTQLTYRRGMPDLSEADRLVKRYYQDVISYHLGAEYLIRPADVRLRAGYYREPFPFTGFPVEKQPQFFTFGAGILLDRTVNVDLAFLTGSWERRDPSIGSSEKYDAQRFMVTFSYRIR